MKALLLAGGVGSRLKPYTNELPKCLMPINGVPLLGYWLSALKKTNITSILINLHHHADLVSNYLIKSNIGAPVTTVYESDLLNTGGTLLANREFFDKSSIMLIHADNICLANLSKFINVYKERPVGVSMTMMTFETPTPESCGIVKLDENGLIQEFYEKVNNPPNNLANAGVYILENSIFNCLEKLGQKKIDFSIDVIPKLLGKINTYHNDVYHRDIGTIESLKLVQKHDYSSINMQEFNGIEVNQSLPLEKQITSLSKILK